MNRLKNSLLQLTLALLLDDDERLVARRRHDGRDDAPADCELLRPRIGHGVTARGGDDARVRCSLREAGHAVAEEQVDVRDAKVPQVFARLVVQAAQALDAVHLAGHHAEDGGDGTDFFATSQGQISVTPLKVDLTDHEALAAWSKALQQGAAQ